MRPTVLAAALALGPTLAAAEGVAPQGVTADDVRMACRTVAGCEAETGKLGDFCGLATIGPPQPAAWRALTFPGSAEVLAARDCKAARAAAPEAAGFPSGFSGFSQSNLLWGTADFLVGRAEEELRVWAVDRFLRSICEGKDGMLGDELLFPETCRVVQGTHLRGFLGGMGATRAAMRADIRRLPALAFAEAVKRADGAKPGEIDGALVGWQAARAVERILAGDTALAAFRAGPEAKPPRAVTCDATPTAAFVFQVEALTRTLTVTGLSRQTVVLPQDDKGWNLAFMALAVNHGSDRAISANWPACPAGGNAGFEVERLSAGTRGLQAGLAKVRAASDELDRVAGEPRSDPGPRLEAYGRLAEASIGLLRSVLVAASGDKLGKVSDQVLSAAEGLARDMASGSYSAMVVKLTGALAAAWAQKLWPEEFQRVASFAADVAEAQSAEAASAAIARAAEPVGGYRRKRTATGGYLGVNGYFGASAVAEWAKPGNPRFRDLGWSVGFWAPIGFEVGIADRGGRSYGLLLQAIDVGVLASWRIANDDLSTAPEVSFKQVLSPGAFFVFGFPRAPVAASLGVAISPKLRSVSSTAGVVERGRDAVRAGLALAVDIPIFY